MHKFFDILKKLWIPLAIVALYLLLAGLNFLPGSINLFRKQKLVIDDTPVIVKEIRDLGELSTSEFYGEVYADINEVYEKVYNEFKDSIALNPTKYNRNYSALSDYISKAKSYNSKESDYLSEKKRFDDIINQHNTELKEFPVNEKKLNDSIALLSDDRKEKRNLKNQLDDLRQKHDEGIARFNEAQKKYLDSENSFKSEKDEMLKFKKERNLVYIGRGWVKAGIDLKQLSEENIVIEHGDSLSIEILFSNPKLLDADINPWFIYTDEHKIKGFEVFLSKTGSILTKKDFTDYEVTQLKLLCKQKLIDAAIEKGLMKNARSSAVQTIEGFFKMLGFQKVKVRFDDGIIVEKS